MSDIKKISVFEYVFLLFACASTVLFSVAVKTSSVPLVYAATGITAVFSGLSAFIAKKQAAKTNATAVKYAAVCALLYSAISLIAFTSGSAICKLTGHDEYGSTVSVLSAVAISLIFSLAVHSQWRKAYKKLMNKKPLPIIPTVGIALAITAAVLPFRTEGEIDIPKDTAPFPVPYTNGFEMRSPFIRQDAIAYYVSSENGDDGNDGLTPATAFASINAAKKTIRETEEFPSETIVYISEGRYASDSFRFSAQDSGAEGCDIIYIAEGDITTFNSSVELSFDKEASFITVYGLSLAQNDSVDIAGSFISIKGCKFDGCAIKVSGNANTIENNEFTTVNGSAVTDTGISNKIIYNYFHDIRVMENGVLTLSGEDSEITGNCFDSLLEKNDGAAVYVSDEAFGITADGNLLLNIRKNAFSIPGNDNCIRSISGNFILNCGEPVIYNRASGKITLKFNGNILLTEEDPDHFPLNAVYKAETAKEIFISPYSGNYALKTNSALKDVFPQISDIVLYRPAPPAPSEIPETSVVPGSEIQKVTSASEETDTSEENFSDE